MSIFAYLLKNEKFFLVCLVALFFFLPFHMSFLSNLRAVDWNTIASLTVLLMISTAIKESGLFDKISSKMIHHFHSERALGMFLVIFSAVFSTFLMNDITLFIIVPLTLSLKSFFKNDVKKFVIFEALAVNVGSTLSPIGNPQNVFLWHSWNVSFFEFVFALLPLEVVMMGILFIFILFVFRRRSLLLIKTKFYKVDPPLAWISIILLFSYVMFMQAGLEKFVVIPFLLFYLFFKKSVLKKVNWFLLATFILIFLDVNFLTQLDVVKAFVRNLNILTPTRTFLFSLVSSQFISNVPSAILTLKFSKAYLPIIYGVNIGGNGILIGSLANIIALKMTNDSRIYSSFHKYSIPYFLITAFFGYLMLRMLL